jgi:Ferritin-like domain
MSPTRRDLLRGTVGGVAAATLGLAFEDEEARAAVVEPLLGATTERQVLFRLLQFEQLEEFAYGHIERTSVLSAQARSTVAHYLGQERRHAELISAELAKHGAAPPKPPSGVGEADRMLATLLVARRLDAAHHEVAAMHLLIGIETVAETIYYLATSKLSGSLPLLTAQIHGNEAQHWTGLSSVLHDGDPVRAVPRAFAPFATPPSS